MGLARLSSVAVPSLVWRIAPVVMAVAYWWFQGLRGFNPTDDGFVLAQSWRLLLGETIHLDFTSPRPVGSAFLHLPEVLSPWATLAVSRLLVVLQQLWIASATVAVVDVGRRLSPAQRFALIVVAFAVNTGVWPVMAWHTIDGIFLGITAVWLAQRAATAGGGAGGGPGVRWQTDGQVAAAWLCAGAAPLVKQGFIVVPALVAVVLVAGRWWRALAWAPLAVVPGLAYVAAARWQLDVITTQIYSGSSSEAAEPVVALWAVIASPLGVATIAVVTLGCWLAWVRPDRPDRAGRRGWAAALVMAQTVVLGTVESFALTNAQWPFLAVITLAAVGAWLLRRRRQRAMVLALLGLALATTASWGVPNPGLFAGSLVAAAGGLVVAGREHSDLGAQPGPRTTAWLLIVATVASLGVLRARDGYVYREGQPSELNATAAAPGLAGIRMSTASARFVDSVQACADRTGATTVAVIPGGAGLYPLLRLETPFDIDWWLQVEYPPDIRARTAADVARLNNESGWLVLYQGYDLAQLAWLPLNQVDRHGGVWAPIGADAARELGALTGKAIACGSLRGQYRR